MTSLLYSQKYVDTCCLCARPFPDLTNALAPKFGGKSSQKSGGYCNSKWTIQDEQNVHENYSYVHKPLDIFCIFILTRKLLNI